MLRPYVNGFSRALEQQNGSLMGQLDALPEHRDRSQLQSNANLRFDHRCTCVVGVERKA